MVLLGRLATWRDHFGFIGGNMGLCAGRKRGRTENNGKPLRDAPKSGARAKRRANANEASFDIDVRSSGTAAGKHFVPRLPNPTRKGRDPIGAERSQARAIAASFTRFHVSVVIEPQPAVLKARIVPLGSAHSELHIASAIASWKPIRNDGGPLAAKFFRLWRRRRRPCVGIERC